jgi:chromosomal replication initiator protein
VADLRSRRRGATLAKARHVAIWLARHATPCSLPQIGRAFDRDHTSVAHAIARVDRLMAEDLWFGASVLRLLDEISPKDGAEVRALMFGGRMAA